MGPEKASSLEIFIFPQLPHPLHVIPSLTSAVGLSPEPPLDTHSQGCPQQDTLWVTQTVVAGGAELLGEEGHCLHHPRMGPAFLLVVLRPVVAIVIVVIIIVMATSST